MLFRSQENTAVTAQFNITPSTSGYQFWIFDPNGGYSRRLFQPHNTGSGATPATKCLGLILNYTTSPVPTDVLLNVRVRTKVAGTFSEFGPTCRMKVVTPVCQTTQLTTTATPLVSCGAVNVNRSGGVLWANPVTGANKYQFEFSRTGYTRKIASATRSITLAKWATSPLQCGLTYYVRVRASYDDGAAYCPFGSICTVSIAPCAPENGREMEVTSSLGSSELSIWPNPNNGGQLTIHVGDLGENITTAQLEIIDAFGKRVIDQRIDVDGSVINYALDLGDRVSDGLYVVNIIVGDQIFTKRLVIAK